MYYIRNKDVECPACRKTVKHEYKEWRDIVPFSLSDSTLPKCPNCGWQFTHKHKANSTVLIFMLLLVASIVALLVYHLYLVSY